MFDFVVVALGVNDTTARTKASDWMRDIGVLVGHIRNHSPKSKIVFAGVPKLAQFPALPRRLASFLGEHSDLLENTLATIPNQFKNVKHVPMFSHLPSTHFSRDNFHPNPLGYKEWGRQIAKAF